MKIYRDKRLPDMPTLVYCKGEYKSKVYSEFQQAIRNRNLAKIRHMLNYHLFFRTDKLVGAETLIHEIFKDPNGIYYQQISIVDILKILLDKGANVNAKDNEQQTILQLAVKYRLTLVVEFLINRRVNLAERDSSGNSILHFLIKNETNTLVEELKAIDITQKHVQQLNEKPSTDFIRWMLLTGVDVDYQNNNGDTALHLAAKHNLLHAIPFLLKHTRDASICNNCGMNAFQIWLNSVSNSVENLVVKPNEPLSGVYIPIIYYKTDRVDEIYEKFLNRKSRLSMNVMDSNERTPVHHLLMQHRSKFVKSILDYFTNVNAADKQGNTVLHIAISNLNEIHFSEASSVEYHEIVRILLSKGADIHQMNNNNISPLLAAVIDYKLSVLKIFKEHGIDFQHKYDGQNLLHYICKSKVVMENESCRELFDFLIKEGCDVNAKDNQGKTPLHFAARCANTKKIEALIECGANVNVRDSVDGYTPLHEAAEYGDKKIIKVLVKNGADVNAKTNKGQMALHLVKTPTKSTVEKLLKLGARIDVMDDDGFLPLHMSVLREDDQMTTKLLTFGLDTEDDAETLDVKSFMLVSVFIADLIKFSQIKYLIKSKAVAERPVFLKKLISLKSYKVSQSKSLYTLLHINRNPECALYSKNRNLKRMVKSSNFKRLLITAWLLTAKRDSRKSKKISNS